jgi:hypothetical protein
MKYRLLICLLLGIFSTIASAASWQLPTDSFVKAKMPMTVVFPRPDSETKSTARQRHAYADGATEYRIPISIQGGAYPFYFQFNGTPPAGMAIGQQYGDPNYGIVTWTPTSSQISTTPYQISVLVTDQEGKTVTVNWSITASTSGFVFVDPNASASGADGSKAHPFNSIANIFVREDSSTPSKYVDDIIYFRGGTTYINGPEDGTGSGLAGDVDLSYSKNPSTWLGYPGETAILDSTNGQIVIGIQSGIFFGGLKFVNPKMTNVHHHNTVLLFFTQNVQNRVTIFENSFNNLTKNSAGDSNQISISMWNPGKPRQYLTVMGNTVDNSDVGLIDLFNTEYGVIENNKFLHQQKSSPDKYLYLKTAIRNFSVRRNVSLTNRFGTGFVNISGSTSPPYMNGNIEVCYNLSLSGGVRSSALVYNNTSSKSDTSNPNIWAYRNTFDGLVWGLDSYPYTVTEENNVFINWDTGSSIRTNANGTYKVIIKSNNLIGTSSSGYIDSQGNLTGSSASKYFGKIGAQILTDYVPLSAPAWN